MTITRGERTTPRQRLAPPRRLVPPPAAPEYGTRSPVVPVRGTPRGPASPVAAPRVRLGRQIAIVAVAVAAYFLVRGATEAAFAEALRNAHVLVDLERTIGLFHERALQASVAGLPALTTV